MSEYLIIPQPDPMDELPEGVRGWLALNARPLRFIGFYHRAGMHIHPDRWAPELPPTFVPDGGILPGPKSGLEPGGSCRVRVEKEPRHISWRASVHEPLPDGDVWEWDPRDP